MHTDLEYLLQGGNNKKTKPFGVEVIGEWFEGARWDHIWLCLRIDKPAPPPFDAFGFRKMLPCKSN